MADMIQSVGRRKSAVARVTMRPGTGLWRINGRELDEYFPMHRHREVVERPIGVVSAEGTYDMMVRVRGGGPTGQAGAVQLAVARALVEDIQRRGHARLRVMIEVCGFNLLRRVGIRGGQVSGRREVAIVVEVGCRVEDGVA